MHTHQSSSKPAGRARSGKHGKSLAELGAAPAGVGLRRQECREMRILPHADVGDLPAAGLCRRLQVGRQFQECLSAFAMGADPIELGSLGICQLCRAGGCKQAVENLDDLNCVTRPIDLADAGVRDQQPEKNLEGKLRGRRSAPAVAPRSFLRVSSRNISKACGVS